MLYIEDKANEPLRETLAYVHCPAILNYSDDATDYVSSMSVNSNHACMSGDL